MNVILLKLLICIFAIITSFIINYFLFKTDKRKLFVIFMIICIIEIMHSIFDYVLFHTNLVDYIASQLLLSFLFAITFEDVITKKIDIRIIIIYMIVFVVYRIIFLNLDIIFEGIKGFVFCLVPLLIPYIIKKELIGFGDVLSVSACGLIIGYPGVFNFLFKTFLLVFLFGLYLLISKKKNIFTEIPLAPFLLAATII